MPKGPRVPRQRGRTRSATASAASLFLSTIRRLGRRCLGGFQLGFRLLGLHVVAFAGLGLVPCAVEVDEGLGAVEGVFVGGAAVLRGGEDGLGFEAVGFGEGGAVRNKNAAAAAISAIDTSWLLPCVR